MQRSRVLTSSGFTIGALVCALAFTSCGRQPQQQSASAPSPDVWAVVDGREIRRDEVEKAYRATIDPSAPPPSAEEVLALKLNLLDEFITQDVLVARARAAGLEPSDTEVDNALAERKRSMTDDAFQLELSTRGMSLDDMKRGVRRELAVQKVLEREVVSKISVTDQDVTDYYNANRAQFNLAEPQYHLAQIAITGQRDPQLRNRMNDDASTPAEAKQKLAMITEKLKGGADFGALAMDYSEDPGSVGQGGNLGFVPASALERVTPQLKQAVLKMQPGNVTTISIGNNHTILALIAAEPAGQRELSSPAVRDSIRDMLRGRQQELLRSAYVTAARTDADVTNYLARQVVQGQGKVPAALVK